MPLPKQARGQEPAKLLHTTPCSRQTPSRIMRRLQLHQFVGGVPHTLHYSLDRALHILGTPYVGSTSVLIVGISGVPRTQGPRWLGMCHVCKECTQMF